MNIYYRFSLEFGYSNIWETWGGIKIKEFKIEDVDLNTARSLKKEICEKYKVIPIKEEPNKILVLTSNAIRDKASDIHLEPSENWIYARYRINGSLVLVHKIDSKEYSALASKIKLKANMDITEKRKPQDGKIMINYNNLKYDLRISSILVVYG